MKNLCNILIRVPAILVVSVFFAITAVFGCAATSSPESLLTSPVSNEIFPDSDGFILRWLLLEPIRDNGVTNSNNPAAVKNEYFPDQLSIIPHDGDKLTIGSTKLTWHAIDSREFAVDLHYFANALGKPTSNVVFWAVTIINCPQEMPGVRLAVGSNSASVWWVNEKEVVEIDCDCQNIIDGGVSKRLTLNEGLNVVRCAIINGDGATEFWARFLDGDGKPLRGYTVKLSEVKKLDNFSIVLTDHINSF